MKLEKYDRRLCLFYEKEDVIMCIPERRPFSYGNKDVMVTAFNNGLLKPNKQIFLSFTSQLFVVYEPKNNWVRNFLMWEDWTTYHDREVYSLPDWKFAGEVFLHDPSCGTYRDVWKPE